MAAGVLVGIVVLVATLGALGSARAKAAGGHSEGPGDRAAPCATAARRLRRDPRVPRSAKVAAVIALIWVLSPIDVIPEFLPIIGPFDDVLVVALALRYAARRVPRDVLFEAWPAEGRILERLLRRRSV